MVSKRIKSNVVLVLAMSAGLLPLCLACNPGTREKGIVAAFRYARNIETGEIVAAKDLTKVRIPTIVSEHLRGPLEEGEICAIAIDRRVNRYVGKGDFVMPEHFIDLHPYVHGHRLSKHTVYVTISIGNKRVPGRALQIGDYVNVLGILPTKDGTYKTHRIMEWLRVVTINGQTDRHTAFDARSRTEKRDVRSYDTITVEVRRRDPDVSLQWSNLQTYLKGPAIIEICPNKYIPKKGTTGRIPAELLVFTKRARIVSSGDSY